MCTMKVPIQLLLFRKQSLQFKDPFVQSLMYSTKTESQPQNCDIMGKPDPVSNLRPYRFHIPTSESSIEKQYREQRQKVQTWNQEFWEKHNLKFVKEREAYVEVMKEKLAKQKSCSTEDIVVTADEMSVFYKTFLDKHWYVHLNYNMEWYKKNGWLIVLAIRTNLYKAYRKLF